MKFAIRDDDTCFFTTPEQLQEAYHFIAHGPVSLSIVPSTVPYHKKGNAPYGTHEDREYPLTDAPELIAWLKDAVRDGRVDPMLHGWSHAYQQTDGVWQPEMLWKDKARLHRELSAGKQMLEQALGHPITVFVAPNNGIGQTGISVLEELDLQYCGIIQHRDRKVTPAYLQNYVKRWSFRALHGLPYGGVLDYGTHRELYAYTLDSYERLKKAYQFCKARGWPFVVYTHYWSLLKDPAAGRLIQDVYRMAHEDGAELVGVSELLR